MIKKVLKKAKDGKDNVMPQINDIGIDLGTSNVTIYMKGRGIVLREPAVVAVDRDTRQIIAMGTEAYRMIGRTPSNINVIRPIAQGDMIDFELTSIMLRLFVSEVVGKRRISRPRAILSVPGGVKPIEQKGLVTSLFDAGVRRTQTLDMNIAAALGAHLNFLGAYGCLLADISAGGSELSVLYNGNPAVISRVKTGGDQFDEAIIRYLRKKYNLLVGERTAEQIKITLGCAIRRENNLAMDVTGRNLVSGLPKTMTIDSNEIYESLIDCVNAIIEGVQVILERTPPQLASDVFDGGVTMTGGASQLYGLSEAISKVLKIPCRVAPNPRDCTVLGCARVLEESNELKYLLNR